MTPPSDKSLDELRDKQAIEFTKGLSTGGAIDVEYKEWIKEVYCTGFDVGYQAARGNTIAEVQALQSKLQIAVDALRFYSDGLHLVGERGDVNCYRYWERTEEAVFIDNGSVARKAFTRIQDDQERG